MNPFLSLIIITAKKKCVFTQKILDIYVEKYFLNIDIDILAPPKSNHY